MRAATRERQIVAVQDSVDGLLVEAERAREAGNTTLAISLLARAAAHLSVLVRELGDGRSGRPPLMQ